MKHLTPFDGIKKKSKELMTGLGEHMNLLESFIGISREKLKNKQLKSHWKFFTSPL